MIKLTVKARVEKERLDPSDKPNDAQISKRYSSLYLQANSIKMMRHVRGSKINPAKY